MPTQNCHKAAWSMLSFYTDLYAYLTLCKKVESTSMKTVGFEDNLTFRYVCYTTILFDIGGVFGRLQIGTYI
jgi:hypothetical protein